MRSLKRQALRARSRSSNSWPGSRALRILSLTWLPVACATTSMPNNGTSTGGTTATGGAAVTATGGAAVTAPCGEPSCEDQSATPCTAAGCPTGQTCDDSGQCSKGPDDIDLPASGGTTAPTECVDVDVTFEVLIPTVALLIDRSASMQAFSGFGDEVTAEVEAGTYVPWGCPEAEGAPPDAEPQAHPDWRWNVVRNVLFNPNTGVVPAFADRVRFGMGLYTYQPDVTPDLCPELIEVDFSLENSDELLSTMKCHDIGGKTPTRESLSVMASRLNALEDDGPKLIILATDGAPNNCACPGFALSPLLPAECQDSVTVERDGQSMNPGQAEQFDLVKEAGRIFEETGIQISVIDVSSSSDTELHSHLLDVVEAGGGQLFEGLRPSGLAEAFFALVDGVQSCEVDLDGQIVPGQEARGQVVFDRTPLALATSTETDGYRVVSPSRIELLGQPCEALQEGKHELSITFPCDAFEVVR